MASLGYNFNRNPRYTNLAGSVGSSVIQMPARVHKPKTSSPRMDPKTAAAVPTPSPPSLPSSTPVRKQSASAPGLADFETLYHTTQFVYATACVKCMNGEDTLAEENDRVMLIYPQRTNDETGCVEMRLKRAHPITGQLDLIWVTVYDPMDDEVPHKMRSFSLIP